MVSECFEHHLNPAGSGLLGSFLQRTLERLRKFQLQDSQIPPSMRASQSSSRFLSCCLSTSEDFGRSERTGGVHQS